MWAVQLKEVILHSFENTIIQTLGDSIKDEGGALREMYYSEGWSF